MYFPAHHRWEEIPLPFHKYRNVVYGQEKGNKSIEVPITTKFDAH